MELGPQHLRDVVARLLLDDQFMHAIAKPQGAVPELSQLGLGRDDAVAGHDAVEVQLQD